MESKTMMEQIASYGLIPVIKIEDAAQAEPLARALCRGGLPAAEVTFRTEAAAESIARMVKACPEMLVGAGTVLTTEQADAAAEAGAKFIVSPGLNPKVVSHCLEKGLPILPGCATPSDMERAIELGLSVVKFFPAEANGGVNEKNLLDYPSFPKIIACGGSFMVPDALLKAGDYDGIAALTRKAVGLMLGFELAHVGINCADEGEAQQAAGAFAGLFGFEQEESPASIFSGGFVELMKTPGLGTKGHIAIRTNFLSRAVDYFERMGVRFNEESRKYDSTGNWTAIYFAGEIGGFAVHLVQK